MTTDDLCFLLILLCVFYILRNGNVLPCNKKKSYFMRLIQDKSYFKLLLMFFKM